MIRELGRGGMGIVYEARQRSLDKRVAVKVLPHAAVLDQRAAKRFQNEAWAAARLQHRNIVPVYQVGHENEIHFFAMQYIDGGDLSDLIDCLKNSTIGHLGDSDSPTDAAVLVNVADRTAPLEVDSSGQQPSDEAADFSVRAPGSTHRSGWSKGDTLASQRVLDLVAKNGTTTVMPFLEALVGMGIQVADALHYAHEMGVVHRDIKPSNLLLDTDGEIWVADFGLAQIQSEGEITATGALVGTLRYMSPEQAMGKRLGVDHRTDVYSLGVTLYELLTLQPAFAGESRELMLQKILFQDPIRPRKIDRRIPTELETIIVKAMAKNVEDRYQSAAELAEDLRRFRDGKPIMGRTPTVLQRSARWGMRNRGIVASIAATTLLTLIGAIVMAGLGWNLFTSTAVALETEKQENAKIERLLRRSEGLRLASDSALQLPEDPSKAILLSIEAVKRYRGTATHNALLEALDAQRELKTLSGHPGPVGHVGFSVDGTKLVSSLTSNSFNKGPHPAIVWDVASGKKLGTLQDEKTITSTAFSPDRFRILTASSPGRSRATGDRDDPPAGLAPTLWDTVQLQRLLRFEDAYLFEAHDAVFDPAGRRAVFPSLNNTAVIYDCVGGHKLVTLSGHEDRVVFAAMSPQGDRVVTASDDNTVRLWEAATGKEIYRFDLWKKRDPTLQRCAIDSVTFRSDGRQLATGSIKHGTHLWDLATGQRVNEEHLRGGYAMYWPDGLQLLTHYPLGREMMVHGVTGGRTLRQWRVQSGGVRSVEISRGGRWIGMLGGRDASQMSIWDARSGDRHALLTGHRLVINDFVFSPDSRILATASADRTVRLWHVDSGRERATYPAQPWGLTSVAIPSPDGKRLAVVGGEQVSVGLLLDFAQSEPVAEMPARSWLPNFASTRLAATRGTRLSLHSVVDGSELSFHSSPNALFSAAAINLDGDRVAAFGGDDSVLLWFPDDDKRMLLPCHTTAIYDLTFNAQGDRLASGGSDGYVRLWDADSGELIASLQSDGKVLNVVFSPDDRRVAAVTDQDRVVIWDLDSREKVSTLEAAGVTFHDLRFSFDGAYAATFRVGGATEVQLWETDSGRLKSTIDATGETHVAMHPNRPEALITSSGEGAALWLYDENVRRPITATPTRYGVYSVDGSQLILGVRGSLQEQIWVPAEAPEEIQISAVQRWDRDSLVLRDQIDIPAGLLFELKVTGQNRVIVNTDRIYNADLFDVASHRRTGRIAGHAAPISDSLYTSDGTRFITASWDQSIGLWDASDGTLVKRLQGHQAAVQCLDIRDDGSSLVSADNDGRCILWDLKTGLADRQFDVAESPIVHVAFAPDGDQILALTLDHTLHVLDLGSEQEVDLDFGADRVLWAEYSNDSATLLVIPLASSGADSETQLSQPISGDNKVLMVPVDGSTITTIDHDGPLVTAHFDADGGQIMSLTRKGTVTLRDAKTTQELERFSDVASDIESAAIDSTGRWLAIAARDRVIVWNVEDEIKWCTLPKRSSQNRPAFRYAPFIPAAARLLTQRIDTREFRDWPLELLKEAERRAPRQLSEAERSQHFIELQDADEGQTTAASDSDI